VAEAAAVARKAVVEVSSADNVMTIDLALAEQAPLKIDPGLLFSKPRPIETPYEVPVEDTEVPQEPSPCDQEEGGLP
jgi:hypothetical protein